MLRNKKQKITILLTFCVALTISSFLFFQLSSLFGVVAINTGEETTDLRLSTTHTSLVEIDDTDPTKDWANWSSQGLCTGSGTAGDPYVIEDDIFNVAGQCLVIVHSEKHFIVRNCTFNNPGMVETIELWNTTNGIFEDNLLPILWRPFVLVQCGDIIFRNNNFTACGYSILLVNSRDVTIENNWIGGSVFTAIELDNCNDTLINNNDIILGADLCIYIDDSLRTTVTNNLIEDNAIFGVLFVTSNHTTISNNDINENQNYGIYGIFSFHAVVSNNDLFNNTDYGIVFEDMGYSTIDSNTLDYHAGGIALDDSPYNEVTKNTIRYTLSYGIYNTGAASHNNTFSENDLLTCGQSCIYIEASPGDITIYKNEVANSTDNGIFVVGSEYVSILDNRAFDCQDYGIFGVGINYCDIKNNRAYNNFFAGLMLLGGQYCIIEGNYAYGNNESGMYLVSSTNNILISNTFYNNIYFGLFTDTSDNNLITQNIAYNNGIDGFHIEDSNNNYITSNRAYGNENGLYLESANNNFVLSNNFAGNVVCINETGSTGNIFEDNICVETPPGFSLDPFFFGMIIGAAAGAGIIGVIMGILLARKRKS